MALAAMVVGWLVSQPLVRQSGFGTNVLGLMLLLLVAGVGLVLVVAGLVCLVFRRTRSAGRRLAAAGTGFAAGVALALFGDGL